MKLAHTSTGTNPSLSLSAPCGAIKVSKSLPFTVSRGLSQRRRTAAAGPAQAADTAAAAVEGDLGSIVASPFVSWRGHGLPRVEADPGATPIVVCPGFGNNSGDYLEPFGDRDASLVAALERRGFKVYVAELERKDWFKVGRSLFTRAYWQGTSTIDPGYTWYLERVKGAVDAARLDSGSERVDLVGHSAGGWLARAFLADERFFDESEAATADGRPNPAVRSLVSLGSPHSAPPPGKVKDMTGGALTHVNATWPGAFFADEGVNYTCVAGRAVRGNVQAPRKCMTRYAHNSYLQVCGEGHEVEGDCVVPLGSALLQGAEHITLDGVFHSMSRVGTYAEGSDTVWYGSDEVLDAWAHALVAPGSRVASA